MRGIPTAFFLDAKNVLIQQFVAVPYDNTLRPMLEHYGVKLGDQLVYDSQCETVTMTQSLGGFMFNTNIPYPYLVSATHFAKDHPVTRDLLSVGLAFPTTVESVPGTSAVFSSLIYSSEQSWRTPATSNRVTPDTIPRTHGDEPHGPYVLGGVWKGSFNSYFQGKTPPVPGDNTVASSPPTTIFVLGTSQVFNPQLPSGTGTDSFLTNIMAFMSNDQTLLGIHTKGEIFRPLRPISGPARSLVKWGCTLGVAILAALLGLYRWRRRQRWREWISAGFKTA
jgi:ABC-type uncharacterized transport system involved in gliding motility auxiliary subunit